MERPIPNGFEGAKVAMEHLDDVAKLANEKVVEFRDTFDASKATPLVGKGFDPAERARRRAKAKRAKLARRKNR